MRVEARGTDAAGGRVTSIVGIAELVATATAATASAFAVEALNGRSLVLAVPPGAAARSAP